MDPAAHLAAKIVEKRYADVFEDKYLQIHLDKYYCTKSFEWVAHFVSSLVKKNQKVLDIGSGFGTSILSLSKVGVSSTGIEFNFDCAQTSQLRSKSEPEFKNQTCSFLVGDGHYLPFAESSFQFVLMLNVVEHLKNLDKCLNEVHRILKPNGLVYILCPNYGTFLIEPHYRVFWPPFLSKKNGHFYLKFLKKNPKFFDNSIFYCSYSSIKNSLRQNCFFLERPDLSKHIKSNKIAHLALKHFPFLRNFAPTVNILATKI